MRGLLAAGLLCLMVGISSAGELPRAVSPSEFPVPGATSVLLGRDLFFDPILSGNRNIACASCHDPAQGTSDGVSLSLGEGARGRTMARAPDPAATPPVRLARHTPSLYNLGAFEFTRLMQDGRVATDPTTRFGFALPDGLYVERPLPSPLAAQVLVTLASSNEMAGHAGENPVADAVAAGNITGLGGAWDLLARRVEDIPEYRKRFAWLKDEGEPLHITDIARVLADFMAYEFRATNSPFDAFLRGDDTALGNDALRGMALFYGKGGCSGCHSGPFQTDHDFHAIGLPQIGPGKGHGSGFADYGRGAITGAAQDKYRFRTPSLRNVTLSAPYGHSGAYPTLRGIIRHHLDPMTSLAEYTGVAARLPHPGKAEQDLGAMTDFDEVLEIASAIDLPTLMLSPREIDALVAFLTALTDPVSVTGRLGPPDNLPSGLPLDLPASPPS